MKVTEVKKAIKDTWKGLEQGVLHEDKPAVVARVHTLNQLSFTLKKMSTINIGMLINIICSQLEEDEAYVNIGVWNGYSFFSGLLNNDVHAIANDSFKVYTGGTGWTGKKDRLGREFGDTENIFTTEFKRLATDKQKYYIEDCWDFLAKYEERKLPKVGFYFYDGHHSYEFQIKALEAMEPYLAEKCIIMIDDSNIESVQQANNEFFGKRKEFECICSIDTPCNGWPTWWNGIQLYAR
jgi:hypothetical protein